MPRASRSTRTSSNPPSRIHRGQRGGAEEGMDGGGQVGVRLRMARQPAADARQHVPEVPEIDAPNQRQARLAELQNRETAARLQDAGDLADRLRRIDHVPDPESDGRRIHRRRRRRAAGKRLRGRGGRAARARTPAPCGGRGPASPPRSRPRGPSADESPGRRRSRDPRCRYRRRAPGRRPAARPKRSPRRRQRRSSPALSTWFRRS